MKTIECVVNGVKVEAGQWWMMRSGAITYIVGVNPFDEDGPINAYDNMSYNVYTRDGKFSKSATSRHDLHRHLKFCTGFDWAGDGYRLLNVETDVAALGDEIFDYNNNKWEHRGWFDGYKLGTSQADFYRRKIATPEPALPVTPTVTPSTPAVDPGEGYRLLSDDEPVLEGDEALFGFRCGLHFEKWDKSNAWNDGIRAHGIPYRRKLPARRPDTEYYLVPGSTRIAYIFRGTEDDAQFQTVLADGSWCVAFSELNPKWQKCTQNQAYENRFLMMTDGRYNDDDDLEEDDDDFTDLGDVDDEDYDDDDRVQEPQNVTINITVNVFPGADEPDAYAKDVISRYVDKSDSHDVWAKNVIKSWYDKCALDNACCGCGNSAPLGSCQLMTASEPINAGQLVVVADQPLSATNPGAGYRLIDKNVDTPKDGDQYWSDVENNWSNRIAGSRYTLSDTYRRKLEPTEPVCEAGYRWLKADEVIEATDQFQDCFDKQWKNPMVVIGERTTRGFFWRRPIKPEPAPSPVEYRMLQVGEVIEKGDEYFINGEWDMSARVGLRVVKHQSDQYRRKIDTTKDRYFVFQSGLRCYITKRPDNTMVDTWYDGYVIDCLLFKWLKMHDDAVAKGELIECSEDYAKQYIAKK